MTLKNRFKLYMVMFSCMIFIASCFSISITYAKYTKNSTTIVESTIAGATINLSSFNQGLTQYTFELKDIDINSSINPEVYDFSITNGTSPNVSEVALLYTIQLSTTGYLPINLVIKDSNSLNVSAVSQTTKTSRSEAINLQAGTSQTNNYTLNVSWYEGSEYQISNYANMVDKISVIISWTQVD